MSQGVSRLFILLPNGAYAVLPAGPIGMGVCVYR